jgi:cell division septation protein DedD
MNRLIEHIERLLLLHDCVIIPDFGGFVLRSISASYNAETNMFFPPQKEVVFNQTLGHNDGLLMESYMKKYEADFGKAQQLVRNDITLLKDMLESEGELHFGAIGFFIKDEERLVFTAGTKSDALFNTSSFGLPTFHFLPLKNRKHILPSAPVLIEPVAIPSNNENHEKSENKNNLYKMRVTKTFVRVAVAAAAAILLFLLISTPVKDVNTESYKASFVPQEIMPPKTTDNMMNAVLAKTYQDSIQVEAQNTNSETPSVEQPKSEIRNQDFASIASEVKSKDVLPVENNAKKETSETKSEATPATASKSKSTTTKSTATTPKSTVSSTKTNSSVDSTTAKNKNFYVIIGSFDTKGRANNCIKKLKGKEAQTAGILETDGHVRVYAQGFVTEKSANSYMNNLRKNTKHKQAWVYKVKN